MDKCRLDKNDVKIMFFITLFYLIMSIINLGSLSSPKTGWTPNSVNDYFVVDFGENINLDKIYFYNGLGKNNSDFGALEFYSIINNKEKLLKKVDVKNVFSWGFMGDNATTSKIKIVATYKTDSNDFKAEYREIAFFDNDGIVHDFKIIEKSSDDVNTDSLFDEQELVPKKPSYYNSSYFDEIYHARTAYEHINKLNIYENTHPPMGKNFIALGILIFGMNPFGWRIIGTLFGAAMVPFMYAFGKRIFKNRLFAFMTAFLMMFDFMHFTQTRIATIDVYCTFFIILMFYYMLKYFQLKTYTYPLKTSLTPLFLSGLFFGIGAACKWITLYGGFGLAIVFFVSRVLEYKEYKELISVNRKQQRLMISLNEYVRKYIFSTCLWCILFFIIIPSFIYCLSYIPIIDFKNINSYFKDVWDCQKAMYNYHSTLQATHPYSSIWYEWPFILRPILYYTGKFLKSGTGSSIAALGNPAIWWLGVVGFFVTLFNVIKGFTKQKTNSKSYINTSKSMFVCVIAFLSLYIPWIVAPRKLTFIYHYFSCVPFIILFCVYFFEILFKNGILSKKAIYSYLGIVILLFILYYPVMSGLPVKKVWLWGLRILPGWDW